MSLLGWHKWLSGPSLAHPSRRCHRMRSDRAGRGSDHFHSSAIRSIGRSAHRVMSSSAAAGNPWNAASQVPTAPRTRMRVSVTGCTCWPSEGDAGVPPLVMSWLSLSDLPPRICRENVLTRREPGFSRLSMMATWSRSSRLVWNRDASEFHAGLPSPRSRCWRCGRSCRTTPV